MESIFGVKAPQFEKSSVLVQLDYVVYERDEPEEQSIRHQSVLTQHRNYIDKWEHWIFEVVMNLNKYANPKDKFDELWAYRKAVVDRLWRHRDRDPFKKSDGTDCTFKLVQLIPFNLDTPGRHDRLIIRFESVDPVDISYSSIATIADDKMRILTDDKGRSIF